jgi:Fe2+ or Zn2+ uptake regulation protein
MIDDIDDKEVGFCKKHNILFHGDCPECNKKEKVDLFSFQDV